VATFPKSEKLCGKLRITALYQEGRRVSSFPLRVTYRIVPESDAAPVVLIWAPKSLFRHAVDRNHLRRLMREAYRAEKQVLCDYCAEHGCSVELAINYIDREQHSLARIQSATRKALQKVVGGRE